METPLHLPESEPPNSIREVLTALELQGLDAHHDKKTWGDWITLRGAESVISIESLRGLARMATVEAAEADPDEVGEKVLAAFASLGWHGSDEDGEYPL